LLRFAIALQRKFISFEVKKAPAHDVLLKLLTY
jgi:hypothetical protein